MTPPKILLLHGPNLSQLGRRDAEHYGTATLDDVVSAARREADGLGATLDHAQHEAEGDLVARVHAARDDTDVMIMNAGALTHYSHALRDAIEVLATPTIELHLSNIHARERFRRTSVIASACVASIAGFGIHGYRLAVRAAVMLVGGLDDDG